MKLARLTRDSTIFFQCDIQERFRTIIWHMPAVIHVGGLMSRIAAVMGIPVIVTEQYPKALGRTVEEVKQAWVKGQTVVEKTKFSMCLPQVVEAARGKKNVVLYGIEGHVCVQQTCLDLLEQGFNVHLLSDGISSQYSLDRSAALVRMREAGAVLSTSQSVIFELMRDTQYEKFKAVSELLKGKNPQPIASL